MSNTLVFNFATFFNTENGSLKYQTTIPISEFKLIRDVIAQETSFLKCAYDENININDYGVLKNNNGQQIFFKIIEKNFGTDDEMELKVLTGADILDYPIEFIGEKRVEYVADLIPLLNYEAEGLIGNAYIIPAYYYRGGTIEAYLDVEKNELIPTSEIFRRLTQNGISTRMNLENNLSSIDKTIMVDIDNTGFTTINVDINNKTIIGDYDVVFSESKKNVLEIRRSNTDYSIFFRINTNGKILLCERQEEYWRGYEVLSDGTVNDLVDLGWMNNISTDIRLAKMIYEYDDSKTEAENFTEICKKAYAELKQDEFNHEITASIWLDNNIINVIDFDLIFNQEINLTISNEIIKTRITKYEYTGENVIKVKFGNVRTALTEKLRMKGVL